MRRIISVLVVFLFLFGNVLTKTVAEKGYSFITPVETCTTFAESIRNADFQGALNCMDSENRMRNCNFAAQIERIGGYNLSILPPSGDYSAYSPISLQIVRDRQTNDIMHMLNSLLLPKEIVEKTGEDGYALAQVKQQADGINGFELSNGVFLTTEEFVKLYDPARLKGLKLLYVFEYNSEKVKTESYKNLVKRQGAPYGYTQNKEFASIYEFEGNQYVCFSTIGLYDDGWKILGLYATMMNAPPYGDMLLMDGDLHKLFFKNSDFVCIWSTDNVVN